MEALDGNAAGGQLMEAFGAEMTTATSQCASCGAVSVMAELVVYLAGPGTVMRCRSCGSVLVVLVEARGATCVDLAGLARLEP
jgi:hypothetical protein